MKPTTLFSKLVIAICMVLCTHAVSIGQLIIDNNVNATDGVQTVLLGGGITATGIAFQGTDEQIGSFNCVGCGAGIVYGLILGTGNVDGAAGPNNSGSFSLGPPSSSDGVTDADLAELSGMSLNNTAVLSFDFVPTGDSLFFNFVFGSEEYPEYVGSINDAFGFFLSGPGISGPYLNGAANIALIPGTTTPISINTLNANLNSTYYNSNTSATSNVQADAFTDVMTAVAGVVCGETYHIKIAIGDASDAIFDSWVWLEAGSFQSNQLSLAYNAPSLSAPNDGGMYEGCEPANLVFSRAGGLDQEQTYDVTIGGTAQMGIDFDPIPTEVVFPIGQTSVIIPVMAIQDGILEGLETLSITLSGVDCSNASSSLDVNIYDLPELMVSVTDQLINCGDTATFTPLITGGLGNYHLVWENGFVGPTYTTNPIEPTSYNFTITDTCGVTPFNGVANVEFIVNPPIVFDLGADFTATCLDTISMSPPVSGGFGAYSYSWVINGIPISTDPNLSFNTDQDFTLELTVTDECGVSETNEVDVTYPAAPVIVSMGPDLVVTCLDENTISPSVSGGVGSYTYSWTSTQASLGSSDFVTIQTSQNTSLSLSVSDQCGNIGADALNISVPPVPIVVDLGSDLTVTCQDVSVLNASITGGVGAYSYSWTTPQASLGAATSVNFQTANNVTVTLNVLDECGNSDSDNLNIMVPPVPVLVNLGQDVSVNCLDVTDITSIVSGGVGSYTYQWSDQSGILGLSDQLSYQTGETSSVVLEVSDECGNSGSDEMTLLVPQVALNLDLGSDLIVQCSEPISIVPIAGGGIGNFSYSWQINGANSGNQSELNSQMTNNSEIELTITDQCGNSTSDQITVTIPPLTLNVDAGENITATCLDVIQLDAAYSGGAGEVNYQWTDPAGVVSSNSSAIYTTNETVTLNVQVTDACGNSGSDQITLFIPPVPVFLDLSSDTTICLNEGVYLEGAASGGVGALNVQWIDPVSNSETIYVSPETTTEYAFLAQDACGNSATSSVIVNVTDVHPNFSSQYVDDFSLAFSNLTTDADFVVWEFSDGYITSEPNPVHSFNSVENWGVTMTAYAGDGCRRSYYQEFAPLGDLFVPNCFTPDHDGVNDVFFVKGHDIQSFNMTIYNRYGEVVFENTDILKPWDGSFLGGDYYVPDGAYNYLIVATDSRTNVIKKEGSILILR